MSSPHGQDVPSVDASHPHPPATSPGGLIRSLCAGDAFDDANEAVGAHEQRDERPHTDTNIDDLRRRVGFWRDRFAYASAFTQRVMHCLCENGFETLPHVLFLLEDASPDGAAAGLLFYPSTTPLLLSSPVSTVDGHQGGVFVQMTTAVLAHATSFFAFDADVLQKEFECIGRCQHLAVLMVLVELCALLRRSDAATGDPSEPSLHADDAALLAPAIRFIVALLRAEPHGNTRRKLAFTVGSRLSPTDHILAMHVAFEPTPELAHFAGYAEYTRLVASCVEKARSSGWAARERFYTMDAILQMARRRQRVPPKRMRTD